MRTSGKGTVLIVSIMALLLVGGTTWVIPAFGADVAKGKKVYADKCVGCHGEKGKGDGVGARMLSKKPIDYTDKKAMSKLTDEDMKRTVKQGKAPMPAWGTLLTDQEIDNVVAYIRTFNK
ncbi:MAG: cytochrome c [candidate division NC10 bacterium]|nr:cytochrome c [candidate division NC10 bacterium]MDE2320638.1 cytochrome c [candidate division NC10 bacterium]